MREVILHYQSRFRERNRLTTTDDDYGLRGEILPIVHRNGRKMGEKSKMLLTRCKTRVRQEYVLSALDRNAGKLKEQI